MMLSNDARGLIKLSLKGLGQEPELDTAEGMAFQLDYESGLRLVLIFRSVRVRSLFRQVPHLYIALYEDVGTATPVSHFKETMRLPRGPGDFDFLMEFTPKVIAMTRAVANMAKAGLLLKT